MMARQEGILLDPVYSGKAMAGMIDLIPRGELRKGETIVFLHTGGAVGLFGYTGFLETAMEGGLGLGQNGPYWKEGRQPWVSSSY